MERIGVEEILEACRRYSKAVGTLVLMVMEGVGDC
jgi:hypothetical protein